MHQPFYTLASWHIRQGKENDFINIWKNELSDLFISLNPAARGTLIQSLEDPLQYYSFGPWSSLEEMQKLRSDPRVTAVLNKLSSLCDDASPGLFRVILRVPESE